MDNVTQHYIIDMSSNNNFVQMAGMQSDGHSVRYAEIELIKNGVPYVLDPDEVYADIMGTKPDTKEIWNMGEITSEGYVLIEITQQMLAVVGRGDYVINIINKTHNQQIKSFPFVLITTKAPYDATYIESSDEFQRLIAALHDSRMYAEQAKVSEENAKVSEENAKESELNAKDSENAAKASEEAAKASEDAAKVSEDNAKDSELAAKASENAAKASEDAAKVSEDNAKASANAAKVSEDNAKGSELASAQNEANAAISEANAKDSEDAAKEYENLAKSYVVGTDGVVRPGDATDNANWYYEQSKGFSNNANDKANAAASSEQNAKNYAELAQSYAVGSNGRYRENDDTDNSEYYSKLAQGAAATSQTYVQQVKEEAEKGVKAIEDALDIAAPNFVMNLATGHLEYDGGRFDFEVYSNGHLMWGLTV